MRSARSFRKKSSEVPCFKRNSARRSSRKRNFQEKSGFVRGISISAGLGDTNLAEFTLILRGGAILTIPAGLNL